MPSGNRAQKIERFIEKLIGGNDQYHLEARVYHGICLLSLLVIIITAVMTF